MKTRILAVLLTLALTISVSAGTDTKSETANGTAPPKTTAKTDKNQTEEETEKHGLFSGDTSENDTIVVAVPLENIDAAESSAVLKENTATIQDIEEASVSLPADETVTIQTSTEAVTGTFHYEEAYKVLAMVNEHREEIGVSALALDEDMKEAAQIRAAEATLSWSHTRPDGEAWYTVSSLVKGENLAKGYNSAEDVFNAWMESDGHRENMEWILAATIYVAYFETSTGGYWSMELGY
ncbi:MAG: CAP domain-containing protein [Lachnospiraceae bacterium]|nr:CAP domain-containing protein [Lachnospiraceae bacterium]